MNEIRFPIVVGLLVAAAFLLSSIGCKEARERTVVLDVAGMTCQSCVEGITDALKQIEGVRRVEVSLEKKRATVTFVEGTVDSKRLIAAIVKLGYRASLRAK